MSQPYFGRLRLRLRWWPLLLAVLVVGWPQALWAEAQLDASTWNPQVHDYVDLTLTVDSEPLGRPQFPELPGWSAAFNGRSSNFSFVNGRQSATWTFRWTLVPTQAGSFTLPPISVRTRAGVESTEPAQFEVRQAGDKPDRTQGDVFAVGQVDRQRVYVGQPIVFTFQLAHRVNVYDSRYTRPDWGGLTRSPLVEEGNRSYRTSLGGIPYQIEEVQTVLYATRPGRYTIGPAQASCVLRVGRQDMFFGGRQRAWNQATEAVEIEVLPLPQPVPDDYIGVVGDIQVRSELTPDALALGESASFQLQIDGSALLDAARVELPEPPRSRVYRDNAETRMLLVNGMLNARQSQSVAIVPQEPGTLEIPELRFHSLSADGDWVEHVIPARRVEVEGELDPTQVVRAEPAVGRQAVEIVGSDILPLKRNGLGRRGGTALPPLLALLGAPVLAGAGVWRRRRQARFSDAGYRRRAGADAALDQAIAATSGQPERDAVASISAALKGWLGDRLDREGRALTPDEARGLVLQRGGDEALADELRELLSRAEATRFGGGDLTRSTLLSKLQGLRPQLERLA